LDECGLNYKDDAPTALTARNFGWTGNFFWRNLQGVKNDWLQICG